MTGLVILILSAMVIYLNIKLRRANNTIDDLRSGRGSNEGVYRATVSPEQFQRILEALNNGIYPPPLATGHYSQGGTQPHLCVCGRPLEEHR